MVAYQFQTIHTLEARSNLLLEVTQSHFKLSDPQVFKMIQGLFEPMVQILASKGIKYEALRRSLIPSTDHHDRALVFNYTKFDTGLYGRDVVHRLLPVLRKDSSHSLLFGDWLRDGVFSEWLEMSPKAMGTVDLALAQDRYSPYYFAYLNNLSDADVVNLHRAFENHPAYIGSLDLDLDSPVKSYISTLLIRDFIKHKGVIIKGHEDDRDPAENCNLSLFDFEKLGLKVRSLPEMYYGVFLSYKIERMYWAPEKDRRFSLNALTPAPLMFDNFELRLEEAKLQYLQREKSDSLKRADLEGLSAAAMAGRIREKVDGSYIYRLARALNGPTLKFNVMIQGDRGARIECALEYLPEVGVLRVLTLY